MKSIRFQAPQIRDVLLELEEISEDSKIKSEAKCLATYELENFEFILGTIIWYDILFAVNFVSKILQKEDMHIDIAIDQLKGVISFFERYRKNGFMTRGGQNGVWINSIRFRVDRVGEKLIRTQPKFRSD